MVCGRLGVGNRVECKQKCKHIRRFPPVSADVQNTLCAAPRRRILRAVSTSSAHSTGKPRICGAFTPARACARALATSRPLACAQFLCRNRTLLSFSSAIVRPPVPKLPQSLPNAACRCRHRFTGRQLTARLRVEPLPRRAHIGTLQQPARARIRSVPAPRVIGFEVGEEDSRKPPPAHPVLHGLIDASPGEPPMPDADFLLDAPPWRWKLNIFQPAKLHHTGRTPDARLANADLAPAQFRRLPDLPIVNRVGAPQVPHRGRPAALFENAPDAAKAFAAEDQWSHAGLPFAPVRRCILPYRDMPVVIGFNEMPKSSL